MLINSLVQLEQQLFDEKDGNKFSKLKDKLLKKHQEDDKNEVLRILMRYVEEGQLLHWRNFLLTDIVDIVEEHETQYTAFFEWAITHPTLAYWSVEGLLKTGGRASFPSIVSLIKNDSLPLEVRGKAIKSIAEYSRQNFDRQLPTDPGYWKENDLRIAEVVAWAADGYEEEVGYDKPIVHKSLSNPKTLLEKAASSLEKKLAKNRQSLQDLSNPSNWLVIADEEDIAAIKSKWTLPENYLLFLQNHSPLRVFITGRKFVEGLSLYGAHELSKAILTMPLQRRSYRTGLKTW